MEIILYYKILYGVEHGSNSSALTEILLQLIFIASRG
jgi:hypothetical protein